MIIKHVLAITIGIFIQSVAVVYLWNKTLNQKFPPVNFIILCLYGVLNNLYVPQKIRIITFFIFSYCLIKVSYKNSFSKTTNILLVQSFISMLSEFIITGILSFIFKNKLVDFLLTNKGIITVNFLVSILVYIATKTKITKKLYNLLNQINNKLKKRKIIIYIFILLLTLSMVTYYTYYNYKVNTVIIVNTVEIMFYTVIMLYIFKVENHASDIKNKYNFNLNTLKEYEQILNYYKTNNHEHNNNIKTIKHMIESNDPKTLDFINSILKDNNKRQKIIDEATDIKISGLNSLIHSKLVTMRKEKIKYKLYVDSKIKDLNIDNDTLLDICKIVGVFIDNAIEEVKNNETKKVNIYIYQKKDLYIEISNAYKNLSFKSTKGKNRGYGLKLVEEIISENNRLENERRITNNIFTQILIVKDK